MIDKGSEAATRGRTSGSDVGRAVFRPPVDIVETPNGLSVQIEMPGVSAEDVDISAEGRVLTVRGRHRAREREGYRLVHAEYAEGDYERSFPLGSGVDADSIAAEMRDGVLTLLLPVPEEGRPRKVEVRAG